jgi:signal transduction histidine kinase
LSRAGSRIDHIVMSLAESQEEKESGSYGLPPADRWVQRIGMVLAGVARETKVAAVLSAVVDGLVETIGAASARVYLSEGPDRSLVLSAHSGDDPSWQEQRGRLTLDDPAPAARATLTGMPLLLTAEATTLEEDSRGDRTARLRRRTIHAAPLMASDRCLGALTCEFDHPLAPPDAMVLGDATEMIGPLLERAMLLDTRGAVHRYHLLRQEWLAVVAHELRHPLHMLSMNTLLLARRIGQEPQETRIQNIFHGVRQLDRMISDLQDASAIEMHNVPLRKAPTDLVRLATDVVQRECIACSRPVRIEAEGGLPPVHIDAQRIEAVLVNVLANADKYGWVGAPIELSIEEDAGEVRVSVTNEGEIIAEEERDAIFDRFRRARDLPSDAEGLGLGLYISRGFVQAHGGRMWVECEPEFRTSFRFTLPLPASKK